MDNYATIVARAAQCRRLAGGLVQQSDIDGLMAMAEELDEWAAAAATEQLSALLKAAGRPDWPYSIGRGLNSWVVSRGADRIVMRPTLESAFAEAHRLAILDVQENWRETEV